MPAAAALSEFAPAKVNLTLRVGRRRPDGYHALESLVVFAGDAGDTLRLVPGSDLALAAEGPTAEQAGPSDSNLVLTTARALKAHIPDLRAGRFHLTKTLPVAAGLGGGSSDAAAALRLLARINDLPALDHRVMAAARETGADVPVCLDPQPRLMRGIGDLLSAPLPLPKLPAVLINPRIAVPTGTVFAALAQTRAGSAPPTFDADPASLLAEADAVTTFDVLMEALAGSANDLEAPATTHFPAIGETLSALRAIATCRLAHMSGSGGTCFGLFESISEAKETAARLQREHPRWWVRPTVLGASIV